MSLNSDNEEKEGFSFEFIALVGAAFALSYVPFVNIPFTWIMTFFHEISHGLAALLTGGSVDKIILHLTGSGLCYTIGGSRFLVLQAGYIGAVIWGIMIYIMADMLNHKSTNILAVLLAGMLALSGLLWGRDIITLVILIILFSLFVSIIKLQESYLMKLFLKFIGIYVLLDAVKAPLHLIDGRHYGDGASLSDLTGIPELLWVLIWLTIGIGGTLTLWKSSKKYVIW